jgi:proline iminopeptidase
VRLQSEEQQQLMSRHREEPWYDDARLALEQEDSGEYASEDDLREISGRFWPMYFARYDDRARQYVAECITPERANPDALKLFNEGIAEWDMRADLARITAATLVITGRYDFICGPACADDIAAGVAGATKVLIEDCGHFAFVEQRERFHEEVARFMN